MKLSVAVLAVLLSPVSGSFLPNSAVASTAKESPHIVPVPSKPAVTLPIPHGHPEARGALRASSKAAEKSESKPVVATEVTPKPAVAVPKPAAAKATDKLAAEVQAKPVVAKPTAKVSPHIVPVPAKPMVKLPTPPGHHEGPQTKSVSDAAKAVAKPAAIGAKAEVATVKSAAKTEAQPAVAKQTAKVSPHIVPVPAKPTVELPTPNLHADAKKVAPKPVAKAVVAKPVPQAVVAVVVNHTHAQVDAKPATNMTIHDHSVSAQKSAAEALHHLEKAKKAYAMTKSNVKDTLEVGKKIEGTAGKIKTLYTPPKAKTPEGPKESAARSLAAPAFIATLLIAALASC